MDSSTAPKVEMVRLVSGDPAMGAAILIVAMSPTVAERYLKAMLIQGSRWGEIIGVCWDKRKLFCDGEQIVLSDGCALNTYVAGDMGINPSSLLVAMQIDEIVPIHFRTPSS